MSVTANAIELVLRLGANVALDGGAFTAKDLELFARVAKANGGRVTIRRAEALSPEATEYLARVGTNSLVFEYA